MGSMKERIHKPTMITFDWGCMIAIFINVGCLTQLVCSNPARAEVKKSRALYFSRSAAIPRPFLICPFFFSPLSPPNLSFMNLNHHSFLDQSTIQLYSDYAGIQTLDELLPHLHTIQQSLKKV
jgi:hypothetical protein